MISLETEKQAIDWKQSCFVFTCVFYLLFHFRLLKTPQVQTCESKKKECILNIMIHVDIFTFRFANQFDCRLIFDCIFFAGFILECLSLICHEQAGFFFG